MALTHSSVSIFSGGVLIGLGIITCRIPQPKNGVHRLTRALYEMAPPCVPTIAGYFPTLECPYRQAKQLDFAT